MQRQETIDLEQDQSQRRLKVASIKNSAQIRSIIPPNVFGDFNKVTTSTKHPEEVVRAGGNLFIGSQEPPAGEDKITRQRQRKRKIPPYNGGRMDIDLFLCLETSASRSGNGTINGGIPVFREGRGVDIGFQFAFSQ